MFNMKKSELVENIKTNSLKFILFIVAIFIVYIFLITIFGLNSKNFEIKNDGFKNDNHNVIQMETKIKRMV